MERVAREHDQPPTLESVFMTWTGRSLDDDIEEEDDDDDDDRTASEPDDRHAYPTSLETIPMSYDQYA